MTPHPDETRSTCTLDCPDRCALLCRLHPAGVPAGGGAASSTAARLTLRGDPADPHTRGFTCAKIRRYPGRLVAGERITQPHVRRPGRSAAHRGVGSPDEFVPVSWREAMDLVAHRLRAALAVDPASVLLLRGAGSMGASKIFADWLFATMGARRTKGSLCDEAGGVAVAMDCGALDMNDVSQIDGAEAVVLWGKHPRACSIHTAAQVVAARRRGVTVVAVNPDRGTMMNLADRVISVRPGSDRFLALAVAKLFLAGTTRAVPWEGAVGAEGFRALLDSWSVGALLAACEVSREDAEALAALYLSTPRVATISGWGLQRYDTGGESVRAIDALCFLAGTLGIPGGGFYFGIPSRRHLRPPLPAGGPEPLSLPLLAAELEFATPPVAFVWIAGLNYLNQTMDAPRARAAFAAIPTVVAVEGFWTDTALTSTVVLPPALFLEEDDVVGSYWSNSLHAVRRVVDPPDGCRTDFEILQDLAARVAVEVPWRGLDQWLEALLPEAVGGLGQLRAAGRCRLEWPEVAWERGFAHQDGRFHLLNDLTPPCPADRAGREDVLLLSLIRREAMHSQMLPGEQQDMIEVRLHPDTAEALGLADATRVRVVGASGEFPAALRLDPRLHPGIAACPRDGWICLERGANEATEPVPTDLGDGAAFYSSRVRILST